MICQSFGKYPKKWFRRRGLIKMVNGTKLNRSRVKLVGWWETKTASQAAQYLVAAFTDIISSCVPRSTKADIISQVAGSKSLACTIIASFWTPPNFSTSVIARKIQKIRKSQNKNRGNYKIVYVPSQNWKKSFRNFANMTRCSDFRLLSIRSAMPSVSNVWAATSKAEKDEK